MVTIPITNATGIKIGDIVLADDQHAEMVHLILKSLPFELSPTIQLTSSDTGIIKSLAIVVGRHVPEYGK